MTDVPAPGARAARAGAPPWLVWAGIAVAGGLLIWRLSDIFMVIMLATLLTFVPYFGAIIAAIPALIVSGAVSWATALWTVVVFFVCHGVEG